MPTSATTPVKPITIPASGIGLSAVRSLNTRARIATAKNGTVEINNPARPDEIYFSASVIKNQGPTISKPANSKTYGQAFKTFFAAPVLIAYGTKTKAPIRVLAKTMVGVEKLSRAMAIKK